MAGPFDFTGQNIEDSYQRILQTDGTLIYDGTGSAFTLPSSFPYTGSALITGSLGITGSLITQNSPIDNTGINTLTGVLTSGPITKVNWLNGYLQNSTEVIIVDWETFNLYDDTGVNRLNWQNGILYDDAENTAIDWNRRRIIDSSGALSANFENRYLFYPDGLTTAIKYRTQNQIEMTGSVSISGSLNVQGNITQNGVDLNSLMIAYAIALG